MRGGYIIFTHIYYMPTLYLCFHDLPHFTTLCVRIFVILILDKAITLSW